MKQLCSAAVLFLVLGCAARSFNVETHHPLPMVITEARAAAADGQFGVADSLLADAARDHADEPLAGELLYWRAIFHLHPGNVEGSRATAAQMLDAYLESDSISHRVEAWTLRNLAAAVDSLQAAIVDQPIAIEAAADTLQGNRDRERELERENARLREALERSNAELERIRRRLAAPPPA